MSSINELYLETNFLNEFLDYEILKCLLNRSSVLKMLLSCLKFNFIAYLYFTLHVFFALKRYQDALELVRQLSISEGKKFPSLNAKHLDLSNSQ